MSEPAPVSGAYRITEIHLADGSVVDPTADIIEGDTIAGRWVWIFEPDSLRFQLVAVTRVGAGDVVGAEGQLFEVCDVELGVDVRWNSGAMIVPADVTARGREHLLSFVDHDGSDDDFDSVGDYQWSDSTDSCNVTVRAMRAEVTVDGTELDGARPRHLRVHARLPDGTSEEYVLESTVPNEDLDIEQEVENMRERAH